MTITGIRSPLDVPTQQTIRVQAPLAADWSDSNYKIEDYNTNKPAFDKVKDIYQFRMKQDDFVHTLRNLPVDLHCLDTRAGDTQTRFVNSKIRAIDHSTKGSVRPVQPGMAWEFNGSTYLERVISGSNYPFTIGARFMIQGIISNYVLISVTNASNQYLGIRLTGSARIGVTRRNVSETFDELIPAVSGALV